MNKEVIRLRKENSRLRKVLEEEGIEPDTEVLRKKKSSLLSLLCGEELRIAAEKGLKVRYVEKYHNPQDKHMNFNEDCIMEKISKYNYYIGNSDICLLEYDDDDLATGDFPEGYFEVRRAKGVKYI